MNCPTAAQWDVLLAFELPADQEEAFQAHSKECAECAGHLAVVAALVGRKPTDTTSVQSLVDRVVAATEPSSPRVRRLAPTAAALAAGIVAVIAFSVHRDEDEIHARGGSGANWAKRVAVELRPVDAVTAPLAAASPLSARSRFAVWYRNAETSQPIFLLAYVVDSRGELHWVAPSYSVAGREPDAKVLPVSVADGLLAQVVELDAPAFGAATLFTIVSRAPGSVLAFEGATFSQRLHPETLLPGALVWRQTVILNP